jgi:hypothetical protein
MRLPQILEDEETRLLKGLTSKEKSALHKTWADQDKQAMEAFTARPVPDVATLRKLRDLNNIHPTLIPSLERMILHPACQAASWVTA